MTSQDIKQWIATIYATNPDVAREMDGHELVTDPKKWKRTIKRRNSDISWLYDPMVTLEGCSMTPPPGIVDYIERVFVQESDGGSGYFCVVTDSTDTTIIGWGFGAD